MKSSVENERLPVDLGWVRPATPIGGLDLCEMTHRVINASGVPLEIMNNELPCSAFGG